MGGSAEWRTKKDKNPRQPFCYICIVHMYRTDMYMYNRPSLDYILPNHIHYIGYPTNVFSSRSFAYMYVCMYDMYVDGRYANTYVLLLVLVHVQDQKGR